jgi:pimeloyl-ACP methyl ester carboxylesterase
MAILGDLPLPVVTSSELDPNRPPGSRTQHARSRFYPAWMALQRELAMLSTNTTHVVAEHAGHRVHRDDPELVTRVVANLIKQTRLPVRQARRQ